MCSEMAGAMLTPESVESPIAEKKMVGSMFIFEAQDIAEVKKMVEGDIYYTSGVVSQPTSSNLQGLKISSLTMCSGMPKRLSSSLSRRLHPFHERYGIICVVYANRLFPACGHCVL